ncbi:unnamed protein product, partial [Ectocarpus sp. 12 AP-2014]
NHSSWSLPRAGAGEASAPSNIHTRRSLRQRNTQPSWKLLRRGRLQTNPTTATIFPCFWTGHSASSRTHRQTSCVGRKREIRSSSKRFWHSRDSCHRTTTTRSFCPSCGSSTSTASRRSGEEG